MYEGHMVSQKGKRLLEYDMKKYYWLVRPGRTGAMKIHILSEDKQIHLQYKILSLILCTKSQLSAFRVLPEATDRVNTQLLQILRPMGRTLIIMR